MRWNIRLQTRRSVPFHRLNRWPHHNAQRYCSCGASGAAAFYASSHRHASQTHRFHDQHSRSSSTTKEKIAFQVDAPEIEARTRERDEEMEMRSLSEMRAHCDEKAHLLWAHRLRTGMDMRERELERMHALLYKRPQLLVDSKAATLSCRPASYRYVHPSCGLSSSHKGHHTSKSELMQTETATERGDSLREGESSTLVTNRRGVPLASFLLRCASMLCSVCFCRAHAPDDRFWMGTSSLIMRCYGRLRGFLSSSSFLRAFDNDAAAHETPTPNSTPSFSQALTVRTSTVQEEDDYVYGMCRLHAVGYYGRMILTPKRHIGHALYHTLWNIPLGVYHGMICLSLGVLSTLLTRQGGVRGVCMAVRFVLYGCVISPLIHIPCGLCNSLYGPVSAVTGWFVFDALSGRWMWCDVGQNRYGRCGNTRMVTLLASSLRCEKRVRRLVGRLECRRRRIRVEHKWTARLARLGFSAEAVRSMMCDRANQTRRRTETEHQQQQKANRCSSHRADLDPYEVLHVPRHASASDIKTQYKKLAMIYHPDVARSHHGNGALTEKEQAEAQVAFGRISSAYQVLSNPSQRRAYDQGGNMGLKLYNTQFAPFLLHTVEEMIQAIFGGEPFRRYLVGEFLRSPWSLRYEGLVSLSLHEYEELQCIRMRQLAIELAAIVDTYAKIAVDSATPDERATKEASPMMHHRADCCVDGETDAAGWAEFSFRCDRFVAQMSRQSFGRELLYEVGEAHIVGAQRFLGRVPFYAPKLLQTRKIFTGMDRVFAEFLANMKLEKHALTRKLTSEFLSMEYDIIVADLHVVLRYVVQIVLQDVTESDYVRHRRARAVQLLGEKMKATGTKWKGMQLDDYGEFLARIQQAATNAAAQRGACIHF